MVSIDASASSPGGAPGTRMSGHPRVTIVSCNAMAPGTNNGSLMRSLFAGWPRGHLSHVIVPFFTVGLADYDVCSECRQIEPWGKVVRPDRLGSWKNSPTMAHPVLRPRLWAASYLAKVTARWVTPLREAWYVYSGLGSVIERQLRDLRPEIVYALLGNYSLTRIVSLACQRLNVPLFIHITDDFVTSLYRSVAFGRYLQRSSDHWVRRAVNYAAGRAAIGPAMAEEYQRRYACDWSWFSTLVDGNRYHCAPDGLRDRLHMVYTGGLHLERWRTLRALALAVKHCARDGAKHPVIDVYAPESEVAAYRARMGVPEVIRCGGWVSQDQLPRVLSKGDILVHVEGFDPDVAAYTKWSSSTKLSHYMMAGRCILGVCPEDNGSARMIRHAKAGVTVSDDHPDTLALGVQNLLTDAPLRAQYGANGKKFANEWFEATVGQARFLQNLQQALEAHSSKSVTR